MEVRYKLQFASGASIHEGESLMDVLEMAKEYSTDCSGEFIILRVFSDRGLQRETEIAAILRDGKFLYRSF